MTVSPFQLSLPGFPLVHRVVECRRGLLDGATTVSIRCECGEESSYSYPPGLGPMPGTEHELLHQLADHVAEPLSWADEQAEALRLLLS